MKSKNKSMFNKENNDRGLCKFSFDDVLKKECNMQDSSIATEACIWFGKVNDQKSLRMHLTIQGVEQIINYMNDFISDKLISEVLYEDKYRQQCKLFVKVDSNDSLLHLGIYNTGKQISGPNGNYSENVDGIMVLNKDMAIQLLPILRTFSQTESYLSSINEDGSIIE